MSRYHKVLFFLLAFLPFLNLYPYPPYGSWAAESTAFVILALILLRPIEKTSIIESTTISLNATQLALLCLILAVKLSFMVNRPSYSSITLITLFYLACGVALAGWIAQARTQQKMIVDCLAWGLLIGALVQSLVCLLQISGVFRAYVELVSGFSLWIPQPSATVKPIGLIFQRNLLADYLFMGGLAACYLLNQKSIKLRSFLPIIVLISVFLSLSMSRSVVVYSAVALVLTFFIFISNRKLKPFFLIVSLYIAVVMGCQFLIPKVAHLLIDYLPYLKEGSGLERLSTGLDDTRKVEWKKAWHVFITNPIFGTGVGTFSAQSLQLSSMFNYHSYQEAVYPSFTYAHNLYLQWLAETGAIGGLAIISSSLFIGWRMLRKAFDPQRVLILLAIATMFVHSQLEYPLWYAFFFVLFIGLLALDDDFNLELTMNRWRFNFFPYFIFVFIFFGVYSNLQLQQLSGVGAVDQDKMMANAISMSANPLLADAADEFILRNVPLNSENLDYKLYLAEKQMKFRPSNDGVFRYGVFISYAGETERGASIIENRLKQSPLLVDDYAKEFLSVQNDPRLTKVRAVVFHAVKSKSVVDNN